MSKTSLREWLELVAAASVVIGLIMVAMELRQANNQAAAEAARESLLAWSELVRFEEEYGIDQLVRKATAYPAELTDEELDRLDNYYTQIMDILLALAAGEARGIGIGDLLVDSAPYAVYEYFSYPIARAWFYEVEDWIEGLAPELNHAMRKAMDALPMDEESSWLDDWRSDAALMSDTEQ